MQWYLFEPTCSSSHLKLDSHTSVLHFLPRLVIQSLPPQYRLTAFFPSQNMCGGMTCHCPLPRLVNQSLPLQYRLTALFSFTEYVWEDDVSLSSDDLPAQYPNPRPGGVPRNSTVQGSPPHTPLKRLSNHGPVEDNIQ